MGIPEWKFDDWNSPGATVGSSNARDRIISTLGMDRSPVEQADIEYEVYLQGSYKNTTHVRASSDVDVVAKLKSTFRKDLSELTEEEKKRYEDDKISPDYSFHDFREDVYKALHTRFVNDGINPLDKGNKAIKVDSELTNIVDVDVDVVPCAEYRYYRNYPKNKDPDYDEGMHFVPRLETDRIISYPKLHYENGKCLHSNYKETVRIFKNAKRYYDEEYQSIFTCDISSFYIECLISNIPDRILKRSRRSDRFIEVIEYLEEDDTDISEFDTVSKMKNLIHSDASRSVYTAETFVDRLHQMWNNW